MAQLHRCPRYILSLLKVLVLVEQDGSKEAFQDGLSHYNVMSAKLSCGHATLSEVYACEI